MRDNHPQFSLRCPRCNGSRLIEVRRFLDSVEPCAFIQCEACHWEDVALQGARAAAQTGKVAHDRALEAVLTERRAAAAATNREREAAKRQAAIADAEAVLRTWAAGPGGARVVRTGAGWEVREPELEGGLGLDALSEDTRAIYGRAEEEAQREADRLNTEAAAQRAQRPAIERQLWDKQARAEAEARRRRREAQRESFTDEFPKQALEGT